MSICPSPQELGADLDIVDNHGVASMLRSASPWAAFWYQVGARRLHPCGKNPEACSAACRVLTVGGRALCIAAPARGAAEVRPQTQAVRFPLCAPLLPAPAQLDAADASKGSLEMTPLWVAVSRDLTLGRKDTWYEVPLSAKVGATYAGAPALGRAKCRGKGQE